jgi:hypothetical protein
MKTVVQSLILMILLPLWVPLWGQNATAVEDYSAGIADNSFLVEEAFNQEQNVVQHISSFTRFWNSKDWAYSFTQEWPVPGHAQHQLSYTLMAVNAGAFPQSGPGFGDVLLNYRYQVAGGSTSRFSFSPRASLIVPTGRASDGRGFGGIGVQANLPFSYYLTHKLVSHWNVGTTIIPNARNQFGDRAGTFGYNLGQSFIWLPSARFNVMLETIWSGSEAVVAQGKTQRGHSLFMSPGIRWAHNCAHGLQIVPGVAVPLGVGPSGGEKGLLLYLSFEHPFGPTEKK